VYLLDTNVIAALHKAPLNRASAGVVAWTQSISPQFLSVLSPCWNWKRACSWKRGKMLRHASVRRRWLGARAPVFLQTDTGRQWSGRVGKRQLPQPNPRPLAWQLDCRYRQCSQTVLAYTQSEGLWTFCAGTGFVHV